MIIRLRFELHQDYVDEIMNALEIIDDEDEEIVIGKRGDREFTCDLYKAEDVISEYLSNYCEEGMTAADTVNKLLSSEKEKDCLFNLLCEVGADEL